jgi:cellulose synthase operon protein YhjQ
MVNDISNLFGRFGTNESGYLEMDNTNEYKELPKKTVEALVVERPTLASTNKPDEQASTSVLKAVVASSTVVPDNLSPVILERIEPVMGAASPATVASLRSLLSEAALKREALTRARNEAAAQQASRDAVAPAIPAKVIALVSPKGGVGKTTLCAALACTLAHSGRMIAIDLDPQNALQYHLGVGTAAPVQVAPAESWSDLLQEGANGTQVLPFGLLAGDDVAQLAHHFQTEPHWLAKQLAEMHLDTQDIVMIDTPAGHSPYLEQVLAVADQIVTIVTPDAGSFIALNQMQPVLDGRDNCSYIVNQFDTSRTFSQDMLEVLKRKIGHKLIGIVSLDYAISEGLAYGVSPFKEREQSSAYQEVLAIGHALMARADVSALPGGRAS